MCFLCCNSFLSLAMTVSWYIFFPVNSQNNSYIFSKHTFYSVSAFKFWKDLLKPIYIKKKKKLCFNVK